MSDVSVALYDLGKGNVHARAGDAIRPVVPLRAGGE
jgi:hypothetical protein